MSGREANRGDTVSLKAVKGGSAAKVASRTCRAGHAPLFASRCSPGRRPVRLWPGLMSGTARCG